MKQKILGEEYNNIFIIVKSCLVIPRLWLLSNVKTTVLKVIVQPILYKIDEGSRDLSLEFNSRLIET